MFLLAKNNSDEGAMPNILIQLFKNYNELKNISQKTKNF
jgi:hypothetical protein